MNKTAIILSVVVLTANIDADAFTRVECMDRPDGSVYIFKRVPDPTGLDVRIYHGWQFTEHSLPGIPIGIEQDFLNARYETQTPQERQAAIADFSPLERLIFNMDTVFHHEFRNCTLSNVDVSCREPEPVKIGREWISGVEFFYRARAGNGGAGPVMVYTIGIRGRSADNGLVFSSGRRYFQYGSGSPCLYLQGDNW